MVCRSGAAKCRILIFLYPGSYHALQATQGQRLWFVGVSLYCSTQCATFMYACLCHFKERMIVATFRVSKNVLYWQLLEKEKKRKTVTEEKRTLFCPLAFVSRVVDVFFCGGVRMYVTQTSSIFCAISFLCVWVCVFLCTLTCTHCLQHAKGCILKCCWLGVEMLAGGERRSASGIYSYLFVKKQLRE